MKFCRKCQTEKETSEFFKDKTKKDGMATTCKACKYASNRRWVVANPEASLEHKRKYAAVPENRAKKLERQNAERAANKDIHNARSRKHYADNRGKIYARNRAWWVSNPERTAQYKAARRVAHVKAFYVPTEADLFLVEEVYALRDLRNASTNIEWEVDHIIPLTSKYVCGLHAWWNLQVIPMRANRSKRNSFNQEDALAFSGSGSRSTANLAPQ